MNEREIITELDNLLWDSVRSSERRRLVIERIMKLFRNEEKKGGEQGALHRGVGAPVGADGGQRICPECGCMLFGHPGSRCCPNGNCPVIWTEGIGVVCVPPATGEEQSSDRTMQPSGSPPLGPQPAVIRRSTAES